MAQARRPFLNLFFFTPMPDDSIPQPIDALEAIYTDLRQEIRLTCLGILGELLRLKSEIPKQ